MTADSAPVSPERPAGAAPPTAIARSALSRPADPPVDRRLARLHLRVGQLSLARAELEALAGSGELDEEGLLALAEARWRTGDLAGAGEAAIAYLDGGGEGAVGLVIAAESVVAVGRPGEARRLAQRALERGDLPLDRLFAGMPRSSIWPADPAEPGRHGTLLEGDAARSDRGRSDRAAPARDARAAAPEGTSETPAGPGFWDAESEAGDLPNPAVELNSGRTALGRDELTTAAVHFALVIRAAPELAPAVLEATNAAEGIAPEIELVRGDSFRLVGHELDARHAYSAAAALLSSDPRQPSEEA